VDVRSAVNVVSQGGAIHLFIGDYDVPPAREPDAVTQVAGLREGQIYDGTLLARYQTGVQFAQRYPAWKLCRQPQIVQSGILRKETETLNAEVGRYGRSMATAASASVGEVIFRCGAAEGFVMATTLLARPASGRGASVWGVYQLAGFITHDSAQGYFAKYVLSSMLASFANESRVGGPGGPGSRPIRQCDDADEQCRHPVRHPSLSATVDPRVGRRLEPPQHRGSAQDHS